LFLTAWCGAPIDNQDRNLLFFCLSLFLIIISYLGIKYKKRISMVNKKGAC